MMWNMILTKQTEDRSIMLKMQ